MKLFETVIDFKNTNLTSDYLLSVSKEIGLILIESGKWDEEYENVVYGHLNSLRDDFGTLKWYFKHDYGYYVQIEE